MSFELRPATPRPLFAGASFLLLAAVFLGACAADGAGSAEGEALGALPAVGKGDSAAVLEVAFVAEPPQGEGSRDTGPWTFVSCGPVAVSLRQDPAVSWERLQLVLERDDGRVRRSHRGRAPRLAVPGVSRCAEYSLWVRHWGSERAEGILRLRVDPPVEPGIEFVANAPDDDRDACLEEAVLAWLGGERATAESLREAGVHGRAAAAIERYRAGEDGLLGTADDRTFSSIEDVDAVPGVGPAAIEQLREAVAPRCEPDRGLRALLLERIAAAERSVDVAVYGLDDPVIVDALCAAQASGVRVRVVTDETSEDPEDVRSYWPSFFGPEGLGGCGIQVEAVRSYGLMHHKFVLIDAGSPRAELITGSANFTVAGFDRNHNHLLRLRGAPELVDAYLAEFEQYLRHCASERQDGREARCRECTPACTEDFSPQGPWTVGDAQVRLYFSPTDDPLRVLRGQVRSVRTDTPDPACTGAEANCLCRRSGRRWVCDYCAQGEDGWGLLGAAEERIAMTMYSASDACLGLGFAKAAARGVRVSTIWDFVRSGARSSIDDFVCTEGVETWISAWGGGAALVLNHHKTVVVDDVVFDGSMNLSVSGARENNENTLVIDSPRLAERIDRFVQREVERLVGMGVEPREPDACRCSDGVDNDGDGAADADDPDCDAVSSPASSSP